MGVSEQAELFHIQHARALPERRPAGFEPAAPRYGLRWARPVARLVSDYFAIQAADLPWDTQDVFFKRARSAFGEPDGPEAFEIMRATGSAGTEAIVVAYWTDAVAHARWSQRASLPRWFSKDAPLEGSLGAWRETIAVPYDHHETVFSEQRWPVGLARTRDAVVAKITTNGYFGAARDRLPISAIDPLESPFGEGAPDRIAQQSRGRRLTAVAPLNMTVLRSGQYWVEAEGEQLDDYLDDMRPRLMRGMQHLIDNPEETGTLALRIMSHLDEDGAEKRESSVYAHIVSLGHLERWTASHETHLSIWRHAIAMNRKFGAARQFMSWHELFVVPSATFEYVNCHPETGILPFCPAVEVAKGP